MTEEMNSSTTEETSDSDRAESNWLILCILLLLLLLLLFLSTNSSLLSPDDSDLPTANDEIEENVYVKMTPAPPRPPAPPTTTETTTKTPSTTTTTTRTTTPTTKQTTTQTTTTTPLTTTTTTTTTTPTTKQTTTQTTTMTTTGTTTKSTTQAWKPVEFICKYDTENKGYYEAAAAQDNWPVDMCRTLVFVRSNINDNDFKSHMTDFEKLVTKMSHLVGFMLAEHFSGNSKLTDTSNPPQNLVALVKKHSINRGGVMYVYNRTDNADISSAYLLFSRYLTENNIRSLLIVDMYSNWEKQYDLSTLAENKQFAIFRSRDIMQRIASENIKCKNTDNDETGPSTFSEELERFKSAFKGKYDQYRMQIGLYAYKEGQKGKDVPRDKYDNGTAAFALLYGPCTGLSLYPGDTDCTAKFVFDEQIKAEEFKTWTGTILYVLHEEGFDRTEKLAQCSTNAYVFMLQHNPNKE